MSRQVRMHWFRITFLFHFQQADAATLRERNPDFSLETQYLHHTNRRIWEGMRYRLYGIWLFLLILLSHIDVFEPFIAQPKWSLSGAGAIDRLGKHIVFCRTWQRLCCYLNNMSSAEVARKHNLWNIVWVNSGVKLQPPLTDRKVQPWKWK